MGFAAKLVAISLALTYEFYREERVRRELLAVELPAPIVYYEDVERFLDVDERTWTSIVQALGGTAGADWVRANSLSKSLALIRRTVVRRGG